MQVLSNNSQPFDEAGGVQAHRQRSAVFSSLLEPRARGGGSFGKQISAATSAPKQLETIYDDHHRKRDFFGKSSRSGIEGMIDDIDLDEDSSSCDDDDAEDAPLVDWKLSAGSGQPLQQQQYFQPPAASSAPTMKWYEMAASSTSPDVSSMMMMSMMLGKSNSNSNSAPFGKQAPSESNNKGASFIAVTMNPGLPSPSSSPSASSIMSSASTATMMTMPTTTASTTTAGGPTPGSLPSSYTAVHPGSYGSPMFVKCMGGKGVDADRLKRVLDRWNSPLIRSSLERFIDHDDGMVKEVERGFLAGHVPKLAEDCCGGTYFVKDRHGEVFAVFKPADEEPYAPENPKGYVGTEMYGTSPMKVGVEVGMAAERECAAYILDHNNVARVPRTIMMRIRVPQLRHLKYGSLQRFVRNMCTVEDMGPSKFPVADVHSIAMLDIRLCNSDRHVGNILVVEDEDSDTGGVHLVPIDHGYVLPKWRYLHELDFCWIHWSQAKQPFSQSELDYIQSLDPDAECDLLREVLKLSDDCLRTLRIGTALLKTAAAAGLSVHDIGMLMVRPNEDTRSVLEEEVFKAEEVTMKGVRRAPPHMLRNMVSCSPPTSNSSMLMMLGGGNNETLEHIFIRHLTLGLQRVCNALRKNDNKSSNNNNNSTSSNNNNNNNNNNNFYSSSNSNSNNKAENGLINNNSHCIGRTVPSSCIKGEEESGGVSDHEVEDDDDEVLGELEL